MGGKKSIYKLKTAFVWYNDLYRIKSNIKKEFDEKIFAHSFRLIIGFAKL